VKPDWRSHLPRLEDLAREHGLCWSPVIFEAVPDSFMTEIAVYGLPVRMPHWSFGARYIYQLLQRHMGYSRLFEVVFPGNPGRAYVASSNGLADNILVAAHVLGHADFSKNNLLFQRSQEQVGEHIIEHAASHARQIERDIEAHGFNAVERVLDAALSLEQYIDLDCGLRREPYPEYAAAPPAASDDAFRVRFASLDGDDKAAPHARRIRAPLPPHPEKDLLWFIATYAPDMESWERGIVLACEAAARSGFHRAGYVPGCRQVPFGCGPSRGRGRTDRAGSQSIPPGFHSLGRNHQRRRNRYRAANHAGGR
jgi:stage V sporulation protein R